MGTNPGTSQKENSPQPQDKPALDAAGHGDEGSSDHGGGLAAGDAMAVVAGYGNQAANVATLSTETDIAPFGDGNVIGTESAGTGDLLGDDDLLGALTSMPSVAVSNIDHTLDQLTTSTDLFDVPALDFHDDLPT
jgi:hypothetical protein